MLKSMCGWKSWLSFIICIPSTAHGPLSNAVPCGVIEEVNKELKKKVETQAKQWGQYLSFSVEGKVKVAKCGSSNRVIVAVERFSKKLEKDLKENTVSEPLHLEMQSSFINFGNSNSYLAKITSSAIDYWASATKIRTTKINSDDLIKLSTKIFTHENNPLYGMCCESAILLRSYWFKCHSKGSLFSCTQFV